MAVLEWLVRLLNVSFYMWVVAMDWRGVCKVSLYKGKCDKYECGSSRGINLLNRERVYDLLFFDYSNPFCFFFIEFHCTLLLSILTPHFLPS